MLQFICPYCDQPLRVPTDYVGQRGKCKKCGARIALLGDPAKTGPQRATRVEDEVETPETAKGPLPPTQAQLDYLLILGADQAELEGLDRQSASELIEQRRQDRRGDDLPTEAQLAYLRRLGLSTKELLAVGSKAEAGFLIERLQPPPTDNQLAYLRRLGARQGDIASLRTKSEAAAMIERFLSGGFGDKVDEE